MAAINEAEETEHRIELLVKSIEEQAHESFVSGTSVSAQRRSSSSSAVEGGATTSSSNDSKNTTSENQLKKETPVEELFRIIKDSTSDTSSIPVAIKYAKEHMPQLRNAFGEFMPGRDRQILADILALMITMFPGENEDPEVEVVRYILEGTPESLDVWGTEFMRNAAMNLARKYHANAEVSEPGAGKQAAEQENFRIRPLLRHAVERHMENGSEAETLDVLLESGLLEDWIEGIVFNPKNTNTNGIVSRMSAYLMETAFYSNTERRDQLTRLVYRLRLKAGHLVEALELAFILHEDPDLINQVFDDPRATEEGVRLQLACTLNSQGAHVYRLLRDPMKQLPEKIQREYAAGIHKGEIFRHVAKRLDMGDPIHFESIVDIDTIPMQVRESVIKTTTLGSLLVDAFANVGHGNDVLLEPHPVTGEEWIQTFSPTEIFRLVAGATPGMLQLGNGYNGGLDYVDMWSRSNDQAIATGTILGMGLSLVGQADLDHNDPALCLFGDIVNPYFYISGRQHLMQRLVDGESPVFWQRKQNEEEPNENQRVFKPDDPEGLSETPSTQDSSPNDEGIYGEDLKLLDKDKIYTRYQEVCAAFGLGLVYCGTNDKWVRALLIDRIATFSFHRANDSHIPDKASRAFICLALGLVCAGSADVVAANCILRNICGASSKQRSLKIFYMNPIALGLIFLGKLKEAREYSETILERLMAINTPDHENARSPIPGETSQVRLAAYIQAILLAAGGCGCGDPAHIQSLMNAIAEATAGRRAAEEHAMRAAAAEKAKQEPNSGSPGATSPQARGHRAAFPGLGGAGRGGMMGMLGPMMGRLPGQGSPALDSADETELQGQILTETEAVVLPDTNKTELWPSSVLDPVGPLVLGLGLASGPDPLIKPMLCRWAEKISQYGTPQAKRAVPFALALSSLSDPDINIGDILFHLCHDKDTFVGLNATIALGLIGAGSKNSRLGKRVKSLFNTDHSAAHWVLACKLAIGLLNLGRGGMAISTHRAHGRVQSLPATAGLFLFCMTLTPDWTAFTDTPAMLNMFALTLAMHLRGCETILPDGEIVDVPVAVGKYVNSVGLASHGHTRLTGFQTCDTPVLFTRCSDQRMEIQTNKYRANTEILEDILVVVSTGESDPDEDTAVKNVRTSASKVEPQTSVSKQQTDENPQEPPDLGPSLAADILD